MFHTRSSFLTSKLSKEFHNSANAQNDVYLCSIVKGAAEFASLAIGLYSAAIRGALSLQKTHRSFLISSPSIRQPRKTSNLATKTTPFISNGTNRTTVRRDDPLDAGSNATCGQSLIQATTYACSSLARTPGL